MSGVSEVYDKFFLEVAPAMFNSVVGAFPVAGMEGKTFSLQVDLTGEEGGSFGINIEEAKNLSSFKGTVDNPMVKLEISSSDFLKVMRTISDFPWSKLYNAVKDTRGAVVFELEWRKGEPPLALKVFFNGSDNPCIRLKADTETMISLLRGQTGFMDAFMQGKLKVDGDLPFGLQLMNQFGEFLPASA
jgi:hypothetical protein